MDWDINIDAQFHSTRLPTKSLQTGIKPTSSPHHKRRPPRRCSTSTNRCHAGLPPQSAAKLSSHHDTMPLSSSDHVHTIVDLPNPGQALTGVRRGPHRTTPKEPPPCHASHRGSTTAPCTPNKRSAAPDPRSPRQIKNVGGSLHPPPHTTPRTHHLKAHRASPLPPLESPRIWVCVGILNHQLVNLVLCTSNPDGAQDDTKIILVRAERPHI